MSDSKPQTIKRSRHDKDNPYAQVSRELLQNKKLSHEARGLVAYLLSKTGDWEVRVSDLQCHMTGRDRAYKILGELMEHGYVREAKRFQNEDGSWGWTPYEVHETPLSKEQITYKPKPKKARKGKSPRPESQDTAVQYSESQDTESQDCNVVQSYESQNNENIEEKEENPFAPAFADAPATDLPSPDTHDDDHSADSQHIPFEGDTPSQQTDKGRKSKLQTAKDAPPPTPSPRPQSAKQQENAALAEALGKAWRVPPAPTDYGLYIKKAQLLVANGIQQERFQRYCDWVKIDAGDFASKLSVAHITENGRISKFLQWDKDNADKETANEFMERMRREHPERFQERDMSAPRASAEAIAAVQAKRLELARGFKS